MLDIKFVRENPDVVRQNIRNKFQDAKLPLVDEVIALDLRNREIKKEVETLRANHKKASKQYGALRAQGKLEEAEKLRAEDAASEERMAALSAEEKQVEADLKQKMMIIPNIIDPSVPIGKDDSENVEVERFGEPVVPDFEVPYHTDIMESFNGIDLDSARKVAGNGFYYLMGNIARLHSAVLTYARDFMINKGFKVLKTIRLIRTFRVLRIFKSFRYSKNIQIILQVGKNSKKALIAVLYLAIGYIFVCALIIFNVEPDSFNTFFDAIYWATISLTTVGYGDIYPITTLGRIITMVSSFMGIAIVALPAGIITAGYMKEIESDKI